MEKVTLVQLKNYLKSKGEKSSGNKSTLFGRFVHLVEENGGDVDEVIENEVLAYGVESDVGGEDGVLEMGDSASQISARSRRSGSSINSKSSSVSSLRAEAAARKAALKIKCMKLEEKEQLRRLEQELKSKQERLELETELAAASAEVEALGQLEEQNRFEQDKNQGGVTGGLGTRSKLQESTHLDKAKVPVRDETQNLKNESGIDDRMNASSDECRGLGDDRTHAKQKHVDIGKAPCQDTSRLGRQYVELDERELIKNLIDCNMKGFMPSQELKRFNGDYTEYFVFIHSFNSVIASKLTSDQDKLHYLEQYTEGKPNEIVRACLHLDPVSGYAKARDLLDRRYGNRDQVAAAYVERVLSWPCISRDDVNKLDEFSIELASCQNAMSGIECGLAQLDNPKTIHTLLEKLPYNLQERWRREVHDIMNRQKRIVKFQDLVSFIEEEVSIITNPVYGKQTFEVRDKDYIRSKGVRTSKVSKVSAEIVGVGGMSLTCWACGGNHILDKCSELSSREHDEKIRVLRDLNVCFGCLRKGHRASNCVNKKKCEKCEKWHPTILHRAQKDKDEATASSNTVLLTVNSSEKKISVFMSGNGGTHGSMSVVPVKIKFQGRVVETRAFLDNGSNVSFCTRDLLKKLGCECDFFEVNLNVSTMNGRKVMKCANVPGLVVSDVAGNNDITLPPIFATDKIPVEEDDIVNLKDLECWEHLDDIPFCSSSADIGLMIGNNVPQALEPWEIVNSRCPGEPYAFRTLLGWVVSGVSHGRTNFVSVHRTSLDQLDKELISSYNRDLQDLASCRHQLSGEDRLWLKVVDEGCRQVDYQNYEIPLPIKKELCTLPNTRPVALSRLNSLKKKFKDENYFEQYKDFINKLLEKGYAEVVPLEQRNSKSIWMIPHFGVHHPDKPESIRVVFDCAAKIGGMSLNDLLLPGPDINNQLMGVLLRFRCGRYAYSADIETMFYQVKVPKEQRDYLRFLWWQDGDINKNIIELRMTSHPFGACSSPSIANFALKRAVADHGHRFSADARMTVESCFYVDDCMRSDDDLDSLVISGKEVKQLCSSVGFNLTKYTSHDIRFLKEMPINDLSKSMPSYMQGDSVIVKALGLKWELESDTLGVSIRGCGVPVTKRDLLSLIAGVYDPLGILGPLILEGRLIMQELCRLGFKWDSPIEASLKKRIQKWICKLVLHRNQTIDRCFKSHAEKDIKSLQWHFFSDASLLGYGAVVYLRIVDNNDEVHCRFVMGKCRVAPLKAVSVPRLELIAATLSVKMKEVLTSEVNLDFSEVFMWTDSTTVLQYIRNDHLRFQTFVANRVALILGGSDRFQWHYVESKHNPADDCSRAKPTDRWIAGPEFLYRDPECWPTEVEAFTASLDDLEIKKESIFQVVVQESSPFQRLIEYYSSWLRLIRSVGWYIILSRHLRGTNEEMYLTTELLGKASLAVIRYEQKRWFTSDYETLKLGKVLPRCSPLIKLKPILVDNVMRVGGRLGMQELSFGEKHPVIIPYRSLITDLLVEHCHVMSGHMGRQYILSKLRANYWIVKGNSAVRRVLSRCVECRRYKGKVIEQEMAQLPLDRSAFSKPPFFVTGLDCFGPFYVKVGRSQVKRYGVIFTCLTIRAIHLEVAVDLSTDAFINALRRFLARRGQISKIRCDRGTNFMGASNLFSAADYQQGNVVDRMLLDRGIEWEFSPPGASHYGGTWERMIGTVRRVLETVMGNQGVTDDTLLTMFCEVEAIVNSRPLSVVSSDVNDVSPVTPNMLLNMGSSPNALVNPEDAVNYSRCRWKQVQHIADQFWNRWRKEYFLCLQQRQKWLNKSRNVMVGDIVLVVDENTARCHWPLAKVVNVFTSSDGLVRRVCVQKGNKIIERPISKLIMILEDVQSTSP